MADASDSPADLVAFYRRMTSGGVDCVFGSRFHARFARHQTIRGPSWSMKPPGQHLHQRALGLGYNDVTNAVQAVPAARHRRVDPADRAPFQSHGRAAAQGRSSAVSASRRPNSWTNRKAGLSEAEDQGDGLPLSVIVLYCLIENVALARVTTCGARSVRSNRARPSDSRPITP